MDSSKVLHLQIVLFNFFGMLPKEGSSCILYLYTWIILLWSGLILVCCQAISVFYVETTNELVGELLLLCSTSSIGIKLLIFYWNRKNLPNILDILFNLDNRVNCNTNSVDKMESVQKRYHQITRIYYALYLGSLASLVFQLFYMNRTERTWKSTALVPTELAQQPSVYYALLLVEAIGNALNCILAVTLDTYCLQLIGLLAGHVEAFSLQLFQYGTKKEPIDSKSKKLRLLKYLEHFNLLDEYVVRITNTDLNLVHLISIHFRFASEINRHISSILFVQVSISVPAICTCAYQYSQVCS